MTITMLAPTDPRSAYEALSDTAGTVRIQGAATAREWAGTPEATATIIDTTRLTGVLAYNPADMTVSVRSGTPLRELQDEVAAHGQCVAFDSARVTEGATIGGLIATADAGPSALAYGSMRDLVIGATVILGDGTMARTGGHVIKNVAGYDLAKLLHGSYGAFGLMTEVVLRLHPVPEATRTVSVGCALTNAAEHAATIMRQPLEPACLEWMDGTLLTRLEGTADGTAERAEALARLVGGTVLPDDEAQRAWARHAALSGSATMRLSCRPSRLPQLLEECQGSTVAGLATGLAAVTVPEEHTDRVHATASHVGGTSMTTRRRPDGGAAWGQHPSALRTLRALKRELDPANRLCTGRFESWLPNASLGEECS